VTTPGQDAGTGATAVEEAAALLGRLEQLPVTEHVAVLDDVHRRLQDALASLDRDDARA
jgi:hypothetical protein